MIRRFSYAKKQKGFDFMELKDTIEMMQPEDYKERFKAEYYQLKIRLEKLYGMLVRHDVSTLGFTLYQRYHSITAAKCERSDLLYQIRIY